MIIKSFEIENNIQKSFDTIEEIVSDETGVPWSVIWLVNNYLRAAVYLHLNLDIF